MSSEVYSIYRELVSKESTSDNIFPVARLPFSASHKIGVSEDGFPIFFIKCSDEKCSADISLELISVLFSRSCRITEGESICDDRFTMLMLKSANIDFQRYFIDIVCILLQQIDEVPTSKSLLIEVEKMIDLFKASPSVSISTIRGLWAELFVIERACNPEYMLASWHSTYTAKFDFNDGKDKVEVKSTSKSERIHTFSSEQLTPNEGSKLIIASIFVIQTGIGKSIIDLCDSIVARISDMSLQLKLSEIIVKTIGCDFDKVDNLFFDYQTALDSYNFYSSDDVPSICKSDIPTLVNNVHFDSNLSDVDEFVIEASESPLFNAIRYE